MGLIESEYTCAFCWSVNSISVDPTGGSRQEYTEDCQNCCRPNRLLIMVSGETVSVDAEPDE